jgi:AraC-like DNA-binding protein
VVACVTNPQQKARLIDALRHDATLAFVGSLDELLHLLRARVSTIDVVVISTAENEGRSAERIVRLIAAERPRTAIVAWCSPSLQFSADLRGLAAAGVHQFMFSGIHEEGVALRTVLESARKTSAAEQVMAELATLVPPILHPFVEAILAHPDEVTSIRGLADALGVHRKTVFNRCDRTGFLSPTELLGWCRLALVAYHLENTGCTVETIALELAYPSSNALRNTIKRYTGLRAGDIRQDGAVSTVIRALARRLTA